MIEFLSSWIRDIVYIMVFVVFLEMLLPNNSMRKYVNVVAGLLIMLVILTPITNLINSNVDIQDVMSRYYTDMNQIEAKNQSELVEGQNEMTLKVYRNKIETQMKDQIEKNLDGTTVTVEVEIFDEDEEDFGRVEEVRIYLNESNETITDIKHIEKIEFSEQEDRETEDGYTEESSMNKDQESHIIELISDFYNVPLQNIHIIKQKNN